MNVRIRLYGIFRIDRFKEEVRCVLPGSTARQEIEKLRLPPHLLGFIVINDHHAKLDTPLYEGDTLSIFPLLDGG